MAHGERGPVPPEISVETRYYVAYSIWRVRPDGSEKEIGRGATCPKATLGSCASSVAWDLERGEWDTLPGQPSPGDVLAEIREVTCVE